MLTAPRLTNISDSKGLKLKIPTPVTGKIVSTSLANYADELMQLAPHAHANTLTQGWASCQQRAQSVAATMRSPHTIHSSLTAQRSLGHRAARQIDVLRNSLDGTTTSLDWRDVPLTKGDKPSSAERNRQDDSPTLPLQTHLSQHLKTCDPVSPELANSPQAYCPDACVCDAWEDVFTWQARYAAATISLSHKCSPDTHSTFC